MASLWDKMVLEERKAKAASLGIRVGDLEEQELLAKSLEENLSLNPQVPPVREEAPVPSSSSSRLAANEKAQPQIFSLSSHAVAQSDAPPLLPKSVVTAQNVSTTKKIKGGPWIRLMVELVDKVLQYIDDPDSMGYLLMASQSVFQPSEVAFQFLCETIYLSQTSKKQLNVAKWVTWRNMLVHRPRLRLNGFYTLKTMFTRAPCNDNFWEPKQYASIETKFYRHLRFFGHGRVLYSLATQEPHLIERALLAGKAVNKHIFEGCYELVGQQLSVAVDVGHCVVYFVLLLCNGDYGWRGHHNMLQLLSHSSIPRTVHQQQQQQQQQLLLTQAGLHTTALDLAEAASNPLRSELTLPKRTDFRFHRFYDHLDLTNY